MGVGGQRHAPVALLPVETGYPLYRKLGGPQGRSGQVWKISPPPGFDPRIVQPVASELSRPTNYCVRVYLYVRTYVPTHVCMYVRVSALRIAIRLNPSKITINQRYS
jgi:hypothetical protein